jgi:hypothetical protein
MTFSCSLPCETEGYLFSLLLTGVVRLPLTTQPVGEEERRPHNTLEKKIYSVYSCDPLWNKWQFYCFRRNDSTIFFFSWFLLRVLSGNGAVIILILPKAALGENTKIIRYMQLIIHIWFTHEPKPQDSFKDSQTWQLELRQPSFEWCKSFLSQCVAPSVSPLEYSAKKMKTHRWNKKGRWRLQGCCFYLDPGVAKLS